jgi:DNA-binding NtrC family response regulator
MLTEHFLERHAVVRRLRFSDSAMDALRNYEWPGNVRELERLVERSVALAEHDTIELDDLPSPVRGDYASAILPSIARNETLREWARRYARLVLERCNGNKRQACRALGISYHTLQAHVRTPWPPDDEAEETEAVEEAVGGTASEMVDPVSAEDRLPGASG